MGTTNKNGVHMYGLKEYVTKFIPPVAVSTARWLLHSLDRNTRDSPFKYLPKDLDPKWIMDIGANEGYVAKSALESFPNANIICFEPVHKTYKKLVGNLAKYSDALRHPQRKVILEQLAVSDFNGDSTINITTFSPANSLLDQNLCYSQYNPYVKEAGHEKIKVITLDSYIQKLPCNQIDIVKIDVEGLERNVINGGQRFFKDYVDIILIEISFQRETDPNNQGYLDIFNKLDVMGFRLINIYDVNNATYDAPNIIDDIMVTQIDCVFRKRGG